MLITLTLPTLYQRYRKDEEFVFEDDDEDERRKRKTKTNVDRKRTVRKKN